MEPVKMTRAEYQTKYGSAPTTAAPVVKTAPVATPAVTPTPVKMTRAEYQTKYGSAPAVPQAPEKPDGLLKSIVKAPLTMVARPIQAAAVGTASLFGGEAAANRTANALDDFSKDKLGGFVAPIPREASDVKKDVGRAAQTVSYAAPGLATGGALFGLGSSLEQGNDLFSVDTAFQTALGAGGAKVAGLVGSPLLNAAGKVVGKITPQILKDVASKGTNAITEFASRHNILPEGASKTISKVADKTESIFNKPFEVAKKLTQKSEKQLERDILSKFNKGVKPSLAGKNTMNQAERFDDNIVDAVKTINENKAGLSFTDDAGEVIAGRNPKSLQELADAVDQTKKTMFTKYNSMAKETGGAGVKIKTDPIVSGLDEVTNNQALQATNPQAVEYAKAAMERYRAMGNLDAEVAQDIITNYNAALKAFYRNPSYDNASKAAIDAMIANNLRKSLDEGITTFTGPGYQALKRQYGSLASIEKDVVKASLRDAKKNVKGLIDLTDIFSGGQLAHGILTMNPGTIASGLTQKGIAAFYKHLNNPNRAISKMFSSVEKIPARVAPTANKVEKLALPGKGESSFKDSESIFYTSPKGKTSSVKQEATDIAAIDTGAVKAPKQGRSQRTKLAEMLNQNEPYISLKEMPTIKAGNKTKPGPRTKRLNEIYGDLPEIQMSSKKKVDNQRGFSPVKTTIAGAGLGATVVGVKKLKDIYAEPPQKALAEEVKIINSPIVAKTETIPGGRTVRTLSSGNKVVDIHPDVKKALAKTYKDNPNIEPGVLEALLMKESSAGYDDANRNPKIGKYAWLGGIAGGKYGAKAEFDRLGIKYDLNTIEGTLDAMAKYWSVLKNRSGNKGKTPIELYDKGYSSGKLKSSDIQKFKEFLDYYSTY